VAIADITKLLDVEEGSAFTQTSILFQGFDDGDVFRYDDSTVEDFKLMFERDGKSRTLEQVLTLPIRQAAMAILPGQADPEVHACVEQTLMNSAANGGMETSMNTLVAQMAGAIVYRKAFFERVWTRREDKVVYKKVAWRPPGTCAITRDPDHGDFTGFRQLPIRMEDTDEVVIPANRAFVYIHGTHRDPMDGTSDLDIAYWCFQTKQKIRYLWYQFLEGQSLPKTIVKARDEVTAGKAARKIIGLRQGGVVGLTEQVEVDTLESSGKGADQFKQALQWLDAEASNSVLAGFTDLGSTAAGGTGSFALSKDQTDFFLMSRQAVAREMSDCINQYLIPDLVAYNFGPKAPVPQFEFGPIAEDDAAMAIGLLQATAQSTSPILPREFNEELIERVAGFLELDTQQVRKGLDRARAEAEAKAATQSANPAAPRVAGQAAFVGAATQAVVEKQVAEASNGAAGRGTNPGNAGSAA